ncbi:kinase-like domain-containing protein [Scenedesmus sp. NREL 46B-D3]|nr:kinase-like domain-containing protein [Scenedesmus sp. NREL 46B-D3]
MTAAACLTNANRPGPDCAESCHATRPPHDVCCCRPCSCCCCWCWCCCCGVWLQVAVKVVDLSDAPRDVCQALQREAGVVLAVSGECRHSCQYKGATIKGNRFCLIMKRYSKSLARVIAEAGPDLDELVVTDFGLSRIVSHTVGGYRPSQTAAGTANYMSPEQYDIDADGNPALVTPAIDLWAWACCMIHMATGVVPFARLMPQQIMMQVGVRHTAPPVPPSLPGPLQQLMQHCLTVSPAQRPTAKQALQALRARPIVEEAAAGAPQVRPAMTCVAPACRAP